ncbi:hypothetical protein [Exiguobacterium sp. SH3S3]|uniref:hypothetical protein n=2 Tax=unclassified Exiguobacterium TaxID=2644629 RepID=UPI0011AE9436|nr:hypothetical protein [Exiguobacterium sp. SH3S3]
MEKMNLKRPWLREVDATTALFVRQQAVHTNKFEQKTESLSRSNDVVLWKVDRYEFDQVYDQRLDEVYRSIRRQDADIFSFHSDDIQIDKGFTDVTILRYLILHPFTRDVYVDAASSGVVETVYVWMHPIEVCKQRDRITRVTLDVSDIATCFTDYEKEPDLKLCRILCHQTEMLILPSHAFKEGEANRLIYRHLADAEFPLRVERKTKVLLPKRHRFSFERLEEESVTSGIVRNREEIEPWLTLSRDEHRQGVVTFSNETDLLVSYYREGLTLQGTTIESVESIDTADYETFFHHVTKGVFPIELTFCLGGTFGPREKVYRLTLHDDDWKKLIEDKLLPQLGNLKASGFWQSLSSPTSVQTLETFMGEYHPHIFGNFALAHDADDVYHFLDHVNGSIKRF